MGKRDVTEVASEITLDVQSFKKQINSIQKEINRAERNFKNAAKSIDDFENSFQGLNTKIKNTEKQLDLYNKKLSKQKEEYKDLEQTVKDQVNKLNELEKTNGKNSEAWKKQSELVHKNSEKLKVLKNNINSTETNINKLSKELKSSKQEFESLEKRTKSFDENLSDISRTSRLTQSELDKIGEELEGLGNYFNKIANDISKVNNKLVEATKKSNLYQDEINKLSNSLDKNKKEYSELDKKIEVYKKQLDRCVSVYGENSKQAEEYRNKLYKLKDEQFNLGNEIDSTNSKLEEYQIELNNTQIEIGKLEKEMKDIPFEKIGADIEKAGQRLESIGATLTRNVTAPIVAATGAGVKFASDFESGAAKVSTIADTTKVSIEELKDGVIDLSNDTAQSTNILNEALYQAISGNVDTAESVEFLGTSVKAAVGGFTDTATAVDGLTTVLNSYGKEANEADRIANQMLVTQNKGKTTFGELAKDIGKVTPIASDLNLETEELFTSLAVTTAQGLATSESISGLKAAMSNIIKPSKEASEAAQTLGIDFSVSALQSKGWINFLSDVKVGLENASPEFEAISVKFSENSARMLELENAGQKTSKEYKNLVKENKALSKELELLAKASDSSVGGMATLFGSIEGLNAMLMLTSEQGIAKYNETMKEMNTNTNALDDAYKKMTETTEFKFKKAMNESKNAVMELGAKLLPTINDALELFSGLIDKFNQLDPSVQDNIVKFAMFAAVTGPVLSGIGKMTSGIGGLVRSGSNVLKFFDKFTGGAKVVGTSAAIAGGSSGMGALLGTVGKFAATATPWVLAAGAVAAGGYAIYKTLDKEVIPAVDLFDDKIVYSEKVVGNYVTQVESGVIKISDATKEAVGAYLEMSEGVTEILTGLYYSSEAITDETANSLITKYTEMGQTVTTQLEVDKNNDLNILNNFFAQTTELTEREKAETLRLTQEGYESKRVTIEETQNRIIEILTNAKNEARELKTEEVQEISELQNQLRDNAITILSEQADEANVILDRMAAYDNRVTAEQAGKHIQTFNEQRDKVIDAANTECREVVRVVENARDNLGTISTESADRIIKEAERQRDETIKSAKETRDGAVDKIFTMNKDLVNNVDSSTGKILGFWEKLFGKWDRWSPGKKSLEIETNHTKYERTVRETYNKPSSRHAEYSNATEAISRGLELVKNSAIDGISDISPVSRESISINPYTRYKLSGGYYNPSTSVVSDSSITNNTERIKNNNERKSIVETYNTKFIIEKFEGRSEEDLKKLVEFFDTKLEELKNNKKKLKGVTSFA